MSLLKRVERVEDLLKEQKGGNLVAFFVRYGFEQEDAARRREEYRAAHGRDPHKAYVVVDYASAEKIGGEWTSTETYEEFNARLVGV